MACVFVTGSSIDCRDSAGGIKNLYIARLQDISGITESSGVVTAITMNSGTKFWEYQMEKENAMATETENTSVENGTVWYNQEIKFTIKKMTAAQRNNMRIMVQNRLVVIIKDQNDLYWMYGRYNGCDKVGDNTAVTGKALGDMNGYTVTLLGKESQPCFNVTGTVPTT